MIASKPESTLLLRQKTGCH